MKTPLIVAFVSIVQIAFGQKNLGFTVGAIYYECNSHKPIRKSLDSLDNFINNFYSQSESQKVILAIGIKKNDCEINKERIGFQRANELISYLRKRFPQFNGNDVYIIEEGQLNTLRLTDMNPNEVIGLMFTTLLPIKTYE